MKRCEEEKLDNRKRMGKNKDGVIFPVAPNLSEMSDTYLKFIEEIKAEIQKQRISVVLNANSSMICLYWNIGRAIIKKQEKEGWGTKVIDRMAKDLKDAFPDMSGFSPRNIKYMRKFARCWPDFEFVQQVVAQIPWRTNRMLLDKLNSEESRKWYAYNTIEKGWNRYASQRGGNRTTADRTYSKFFVGIGTGICLCGQTGASGSWR